MKAISLWQPWASAIPLRLKRFETRSWKCPDALVGNLLAIHAAKKKDESGAWRWMQHSLGIEEGQTPDDFPPEKIQKATQGFWNLPYGAVVAIVRVVKCWKTEDLVAIPDKMTADELKWGDYTPGRYAWELKPVHVFSPAIPVKGKQGLFEWQIPDEWMKQAADEAGMPGMFEIWKAVKE